MEKQWAEAETWPGASKLKHLLEQANKDRQNNDPFWEARNLKDCLEHLHAVAMEDFKAHKYEDYCEKVRWVVEAWAANWGVK